MECHAEHIIQLMLQLAIIFIVAKSAAEIAVRYIKVPPVLGELFAGVIIGPFALGAIALGSFGPLFPGDHGHEIPPEINFLGQVASLVLMFVVGIETNLEQFLKYARKSFFIAIGGVAVPFTVGASLTVLFGFAESFMSIQALFIGSILTATSIGITARILKDLGKLDGAEGITILAAAVFDDVFGILVLAIVISLNETQTISSSNILIIAVQAVGIWLAITALSFLLSSPLSRFISGFNTEGALVAIPLGLALICAALAEHFGLAMIIGAYSFGLGMSNSKIKHEIEHQLHNIYNLLVPVFFVVMGMMVDLSAISTPVLVFGIVLSLTATLDKLIGSGIPAFFSGFNRIGSLRIGVGMIPRGEIALIIAGIGLSKGIIGTDLFGVSVIMTMSTTIIASIILPRLFKNNQDGIKK